jgi:diketogulonate reductase-like aldo/keto reductase
LSSTRPANHHRVQVAGESAAQARNRVFERHRISVPVVGLGTWQRLEAAAAAGRHRELIDTAVTTGIRLFDTSPMYGDAQRLLADALDGRRDEAFIADKIWTPSEQEGAAQLARAVDWYGGRVDLMQIHNLVSWPATREAFWSLTVGLEDDPYRHIAKDRSG